MTDVIKALQENDLPFCKMADTLRIKAGQIDRIHFLVLGDDGKFSRCIENGKFWLNGVFQLRPDYTEDEGVGIDKCAVRREGGAGDLVYRQGTLRSLHQAMNDPDFIGYLYENSEVLTTPRKYVHEHGHTRVYLTDITSGDVKVLTPIAVLFRSKP